MKISSWKMALICLGTAIAIALILSSCITMGLNYTAVNVGDFCSGFVVKQDVVMTAAHCVRGNFVIGDRIMVKINDEIRPFTVQFVSNKIDAALLSGPTSGMLPVKMASRLPMHNELCTGVGFPLGMPIKVTTEINYVMWRGQYLWFKGPAEFGFSGSPIYDSDGNVTGMLVAMTKFFTLGMPGPELVDFIKNPASHMTPDLDSQDNDKIRNFKGRIILIER